MILKLYLATCLRKQTRLIGFGLHPFTATSISTTSSVSGILSLITKKSLITESIEAADFSVSGHNLANNYKYTEGHYLNMYSYSSDKTVKAKSVMY